MLVLQKSLLDRQCIYSNVAVRAQENLCLLSGIVPGSTAQVRGCGQCGQLFAFSDGLLCSKICLKTVLKLGKTFLSKSEMWLERSEIEMDWPTYKDAANQAGTQELLWGCSFGIIAQSPQKTILGPILVIYLKCVCREKIKPLHTNGEFTPCKFEKESSPACLQEAHQIYFPISSCMYLVFGPPILILVSRRGTGNSPCLSTSEFV